MLPGGGASCSALSSTISQTSPYIDTVLNCSVVYYVHWMSDVRGQMSDVRCWLLDIGCRILDITPVPDVPIYWYQARGSI